MVFNMRRWQQPSTSVSTVMISTICSLKMEIRRQNEALNDDRPIFQHGYSECGCRTWIGIQSETIEDCSPW
jgi:hypothetical protein